MMANEIENRQKLLRAVKKEVKQIMEEAVTRKFVHEESSSITSLSGAVEACLLHGLKKRALGLFKHSTTTALLQKVSKNFEPAAVILKLLSDVESSNDPNKKSVDSNKNQTKKLSQYNPRYLWIRLAIFEKQLAKILDYLVQNNSKFYEEEALISDPVDGPIFASLLVGPCALDYTKMKTLDHYWTDPPADELVQRHRIHSSTNHLTAGPGSPKRPGLQVRRNTSSSSEESSKSFHLSAKDYVESLHQNSKTTLLYGKNNVLVQPKEDVEALAGYLSLHQSAMGLTIMWTPNQLMNGCCEEESDEKDRSRSTRNSLYKHTLKQYVHCKVHLYWDYALTVYLDEIVYIHCHQQPDCGGTIVLVGQDGVQRPPIHFPKGGHLLAFLSCLENGLLPHGQLDPPLWSQRGKGVHNRQASMNQTYAILIARNRKVFPKLKRKGSRLSNISQEGSTSSSSTEEDEATDYVFRIITTFRPSSIPPEMMDPKAKIKGENFSWANRIPRLPSPLAQSSVQDYAKSQEEQNNSCLSKQSSNHRSGTTLKQLCDTMKKQIISRAFYGWLAHCRHLKTVRTHLSGLVLGSLVNTESDYDMSAGLTEEQWKYINKDNMVSDPKEVYRLVYNGGVAHEIRKDVWPYLLGHYSFSSTPEERQKVDEVMRTMYERTMSEWLAIEAIVKQRDKEIMAANLAKLSSHSSDGPIPLVRKDSSLSNDVFESQQSFDEWDDFSHPETVPEESSATGTTCTPTPDRKQSMELHLQQSEVIEKMTQTEILLEKRDYVCTSFSDSPDDGLGDSIARQSSQERSKLDSAGDSEGTDISRADREGSMERHIIVTKMSCSMDSAEADEEDGGEESDDEEEDDDDDDNDDVDGRDGLSSQRHSLTADNSGKTFDSENIDNLKRLSTSHESLISPASPASNGGVYSAELLDNVALNLHRIDKDVQRCDRNYWYFTPANLEKLRNVMCTFVWEHLDVGYVQGMCDLVAPLLVVFDDEAMTYSCFCELMKRMSSNFPHGGAMDTHFANMRSLIQILDSELFEHMHHHGDYTHFYFCYRWFLLDFKRELLYDDVFAVWETIWVAKYISSPHFVLFIALALVEFYRDIILDNNMDFTDIIKFFNEMAERHKAKQVLKIARDLVHKLQTLIDNK
ncbi:small G protein signaling modulator 1-like isoform X4 [Argopecten irradians]|uniref:small G protein signaling modulator 1-like isoform X4 n=1 Tax=Argopecten irradians TaxID=31199 RepID=UPI0037118A34